jgi:hypothetical protein
MAMHAPKMGIDSFWRQEQYFAVRVFRWVWASFGIARSASQARSILHEGIACACLGWSFVRQRASVVSTSPKGTRGFDLAVHLQLAYINPSGTGFATYPAARII